uniref:Dihydrolipoyllysine-residue succinyltransferase component of 2-oxoglutarate dehydrogenase complex, mitochondrial n=1 Tax=Ditylenchus dipsaci TaxID=166011 RepID=A0A915CSH6_9BILA
MNRMRIRIAERLKEAQNTNAMLTTFNEKRDAFAQKIPGSVPEKAQREAGSNVTICSCRCHRLAGSTNCQCSNRRNEIVYRNSVIFDSRCNSEGSRSASGSQCRVYGYAQIEKTMAELALKARDGKIAIEDMEGGTFTISNGAFSALSLVLRSSIHLNLPFWECMNIRPADCCDGKFGSTWVICSKFSFSARSTPNDVYCSDLRPSLD